MTQRHPKKVAIVGAGGNIGRYMVESLLSTGKHTITALTRNDSATILPTGVVSRCIDYNEPATLVSALEGQDVLIITLGGLAPPGTEKTLVEAAGEAGVKWILPNEWSPDTANEGLVNDVFVFQPKVSTRRAVEELGKSSYIAVCTGFWYEYTLAMPQSFGIDISERTATLFDDGDTRISVSTMPQVGRAVAALLSLPLRKSSEQPACLEDFKNRIVYVNSFTISQRDMLESVRRVTATTEDDWTISKESIHRRYADGIHEIQKGKRAGYAKMMYGRVFYADGCGNFEENKGILNEVLGLPKQDLDQFTRDAIERAKGNTNWTDHK